MYQEYVYFRHRFYFVHRLYSPILRLLLLFSLMNVFSGGSWRRRLFQWGQDERHLCEGMAQGSHSLSPSSSRSSWSSLPSSSGTRGLPGNWRPLSIAHRGRKLQLEVWLDFNFNLTTSLYQVYLPLWLPGSWGKDCDQQKGKLVQVAKSFISWPKLGDQI